MAESGDLIATNVSALTLTAPVRRVRVPLLDVKLTFISWIVISLFDVFDVREMSPSSHS